MPTKARVDIVDMGEATAIVAALSAGAARVLLDPN